MLKPCFDCKFGSYGCFPAVMAGEVPIDMYIACSTLALLTYDYALTFSDEVHLIWSSTWRVGKIVFFLTRYLAFIDLPLRAYTIMNLSISPSQCQIMRNFCAWMAIIGIEIAEIIMLLRVWALYGRTRSVTVFLTCVAAVGFVIANVAIYLYMHPITASLGLPTPLPKYGCYDVVPGKAQFAILGLGTLILMECLTVVMTCRKCIHTALTEKSSLASVCLRDGLIYFVCQLVASLLNVVAYLGTHVPPPGFLITQRGLHSILSARVLLDLREAVYSPSELHVDYRAQGARSLRFIRSIGTSWLYSDENIR